MHVDGLLARLGISVALGSYKLMWNVALDYLANGYATCLDHTVVLCSLENTTDPVAFLTLGGIVHWQRSRHDISFPLQRVFKVNLT